MQIKLKSIEKNEEEYQNLQKENLELNKLILEYKNTVENQNYKIMNLEEQFEKSESKFDNSGNMKKYLEVQKTVGN